jgi:hypothetical protein
MRHHSNIVRDLQPTRWLTQGLNGHPKIGNPMKFVYGLTIVLVGFSSSPLAAATPVLTLKAGGLAIEFTADELLARPDAETIAVARDPTYGKPMSYLGIPCVPYSRRFRLI